MVVDVGLWVAIFDLFAVVDAVAVIIIIFCIVNAVVVVVLRVGIQVVDDAVIVVIVV